MKHAKMSSVLPARRIGPTEQSLCGGLGVRDPRSGCAGEARRPSSFRRHGCRPSGGHAPDVTAAFRRRHTSRCRPERVRGFGGTPPRPPPSDHCRYVGTGVTRPSQCNVTRRDRMAAKKMIRLQAPGRQEGPPSRPQTNHTKPADARYEHPLRTASWGTGVSPAADRRNAAEGNRQRDR